MKEILVLRGSFAGKYAVVESLTAAVREFGIDGVDSKTIRDFVEYNVIVDGETWIHGLSMTEALGECEALAQNGIEAWYQPAE